MSSVEADAQVSIDSDRYPPPARVNERRAWLALLDQGLAREEREAIYRVLREAVPDFRGAAA